MSYLPLHEIVHQFKELERLADLGDIPQEVIADTLESLEGDFEDKAVNVARFILNLDADAAAIRELATATAQRAGRVQKRADDVRNWLLFNLQALGRNKIQRPDFTISVRDNPVSVVVNDGAVLAAEYMVQPEPPPPKADKKALKAALENGEEIAGVWLQRGQRVEIRT